MIKKHKKVGNQLSNLVTDQFDGQTGIVYCITIKDCLDICAHLKEAGIGAAVYFAGHPQNDRNQHQWQTGVIQVIVATKAYGMGINQANVCSQTMSFFFLWLHVL